MITTPSTCFSGRVPYRSGGQVVPCTSNPTICPTGTLCERSNVASSLICCVVGQLTTSSCPTGWQPYIISVTTPQSCASITDTSCPSGYSCTQSNIAGSFLCCRYGISTTLRCYNSAQNPFLEANGQPRVCSTLTPNCPTGYSCQSSTQVS